MAFFPVRLLLGFGIGMSMAGVFAVSLVFAYFGFFLVCVAMTLKLRLDG